MARDGRPYGTLTGSVTVDMATVRQRKREMVDRQIAQHLQIYQTSGAELIMGNGRLLAPKTLEVKLNDGGTRVLRATRSSSTSERTRPFRMFLASKQPSPSRMSRRWTLAICHDI